MKQPVKEHIAKLRDEIAQAREANRQYLHGGKKSPATAPDHERRLHRLKEILVELASLTKWKEPYPFRKNCSLALSQVPYASKKKQALMTATSDASM